MFKKIPERSFLVIISLLLSVIFTSNAQKKDDAYPDNTAMDCLQDDNYASLPDFAVDSLYNFLLGRAMGFQHAADSIEEAVIQYRRQIMSMDGTYERIKLQQKVVMMEELMREIQSEADSLFMMLDEMAEPEHEISGRQGLILDTVIEGIKVYHYNLGESGKIPDEANRDGAGEEGTAVRFPEYEAGGNDFKILPQSPYSPEHPFETDFQIPPGIFYRIQVAVFSQEIKYDHFGGICPVTTQVVENENITKYFAGKFTVYAEAVSALGSLREAGFKDSFIVGYYNAQRMSVERVREFEKENQM